MKRNYSIKRKRAKTKMERPRVSCVNDAKCDDREHSTVDDSDSEANDSKIDENRGVIIHL